MRSLSPRLPSPPAATTRPAAAPTTGSTLRATLVDRDGDGFLEAGPGEPLRDRGEPSKPGRTLATFAQLTDAHVRDEESPARVPFLDRTGAPFTSTFRPQEAFSTQVLDAAVRALNRERPQAVFVTGDITDNAQRNELTQALATLNGGTVRPDSGAPGYAGVQAADSADPFYYRPDHDAPTHPGALQAAQRPFKAEGLRAPWYPLVGNHDVLAQGEVPVTPEIDAFATGDRLVSSLPPRLEPPRDEAERTGRGRRAARRSLGARHDRGPRRPRANAQRARRSRAPPRPAAARPTSEHACARSSSTPSTATAARARESRPSSSPRLASPACRPTAGSSSSRTTR